MSTETDDGIDNCENCGWATMLDEVEDPDGRLWRVCGGCGEHVANGTARCVAQARERTEHYD